MKTNMKKLMALLAGMAANLTVHAAVSYGTDGSCDYDMSVYSLQEVIDLGEYDIRLTTQANIPSSLILNRDFFSIKGGFADCDDANNNVSSANNTQLLGNGQLPVIRINAPQNQDSATVHLSQVTLANGHHTQFHNGGGLSAYDFGDKSITVFLDDALITQNIGSRGGGVFVRGDQVSVIMRNTMVINNQTEGQAGGSALGGGIYCNEGSISIESGSGISHNQAYSNIQNAGHGGGIYATNDCEVEIHTGTAGGLLDFRGISFNQASGHGGGIYAGAGSRVRLISNTNHEPININENQTDTNLDGLGDGGGIYLTGPGTSLAVNGGLINNNYALNGAGVAITDGALASFYALGNDCWNQTACNQVIGNQTLSGGGQGGGLFVSDALLFLERTHILENRAHAGTALYAGDGSSATMHRIVVARNGQGGGNWDDSHVFRMVDSTFTMYQITTALNDAVMATISAQNSVHVINNSIFHEPLTNQLGNFIGGSGSKDCNLVDNTFGWQNHSNTFLESPGFVNSANDDFHIKAESPAIDRCANGNPATRSAGGVYDIDGEPVAVDHPDADNGLGFFDIGADEYHPSDVIFRSGFENN